MGPDTIGEPVVKLVLSPEFEKAQIERRADIERRYPHLRQQNQQLTEEHQPVKLKRPRLSKAARAKLKSRLNSIPDFERHSRKCQICNHPACDEIEEAFFAWRSARAIARFFQLTDSDAVYRHAHAIGLDALRRQNVRMVVEKVLEEVHRVDSVSASSILRGVRTLASLNDSGQWVEPPTTHIAVSTTASVPKSEPSAAVTSNRGNMGKVSIP